MERNGKKCQYKKYDHKYDEIVEKLSWRELFDLCLNMWWSIESMGRRRRHIKNDPFTRLVNIYCNQKNRCNNKNHIHYKRYGGRGITFHQPWIDCANEYFRYVLSIGWEPGLEIDRIDNNNGYVPGNLRIVDKIVNCNNRENTRYVTAFGETKCLKDWSRDQRCMVSYKRLWTRIKEGNLSIEDCIAKSPKTRNKIND